MVTLMSETNIEMVCYILKNLDYVIVFYISRGRGFYIIFARSKSLLSKSNFIKDMMHCAAMFSLFFFHFIFVLLKISTADMTNEEFLEYWLILPWGNRLHY